MTTDTDVPQQMAKSDFNLTSVSTEQYAEILRAAIETDSNVAVFGRRGSGKTIIAKDVVRDGSFFETRSKVREVYVNLSTCERPDMGGYPDMFGLTIDKHDTKEAKRQRFVQFILPMFFQPLMEGNERVVAIFDEVDKADESIHAPLLEITQFKSINGRPLTNLCASIFTGNLISEGSKRPSLPLLDRTEKYLLRPDVGSWLKWAGTSGKIHPSVTAFLHDKGHYLFGSEDGCGDNYAEPSPRGWELASRVLFAGEKLGWHKDLLNMKVAGFIGKEAGTQYDIYFNHYQELLPLVKQIFDGNDVTVEYEKLGPSMQLYAAMIVCSRLSGILDKADLVNRPKELGYVGRFMQGVSDENVLISVRTQLVLHRLTKWRLDSDKDWGKLLNDITKSADKQ